MTSERRGRVRRTRIPGYQQGRISGREERMARRSAQVPMASVGGLIRLDWHAIATPLVRRALTSVGVGFNLARRWVGRPDRVYLTYPEWAGPSPGSDVEVEDDGSTFFAR